MPTGVSPAHPNIVPQKKIPKIKRKKYQSLGYEMIHLFTMVMHK